MTNVMDNWVFCTVVSRNNERSVGPLKVVAIQLDCGHIGEMEADQKGGPDVGDVIACAHCTRALPSVAVAL